MRTHMEHMLRNVTLHRGHICLQAHKNNNTYLYYFIRRCLEINKEIKTKFKLNIGTYPHVCDEFWGQRNLDDTFTEVG